MGFWHTVVLLEEGTRLRYLRAVCSYFSAENNSIALKNNLLRRLARSAAFDACVWSSVVQPLV
jgi:hypothetical protein